MGRSEYRLLIKPSAVKELEDLPKKDRRLILRRLQTLGEDARPMGSEKISSGDRCRVRQGIYRILYEVSDRAKTVTVVKIGHRREVYR